MLNKTDRRKKSPEGRTVRLSARITPTAHAWLTRGGRNAADAIETMAQGDRMNTIIESKGVFLSIETSDYNTMIESTSQALVTVYELPDGEYAVLDRSMVGSYITYLAASVGEAMGIYRRCREAIE